jgi:hypothetical protein
MGSFTCVQDEKVIIADYIFKKFSSMTCPCKAPQRAVCAEIPDKDKRSW